ncbi:MAG TPA: monovalent cation/H(+) antiporter subunit G [Candidatus Scatomorpha merdavium]|jgi:multicomponent Na+:H+ antiporter subunit G|nr:monovalent cation/H(+) antiporter subunit G [Oscillospiraceae bacterium]HIS15773.1 monovalent cation/H(+) antiporter subunit G [Candidatus Scatomorpha merdavium]
MNIVLRVIIDLFIVGGCFFAFAGAVGIVRMPDTFSRMQSSTNITTLGILLTLVGAFLYFLLVMHSWGSAAKVVVIGVLTVVANPVGGHAVARAAYRIGVRPKRELVVDDLADPEACVEPEAPAEVEKEGDEA